MKSSLEKIVKEYEESKKELGDESSNSKRSRKSLRGRSEISTFSHIFPNVCICCEKISKYKKGKTREKLVKSCELKAEKIVKAAVHQKRAQRMLSIT